MNDLGSGKERLKRGHVYILVVILIAYKVFYLIPGLVKAGGFDLRDVALILIWAGAGWLLLSGARARVLAHPLSILVLFYLFLVLAHISLARFNYDQSILNGIVHARNQFMYVAFFLYVFILSTPEDIAKLLDALSVIAVIVLFLSVIHYFFPVVFHGWHLPGVEMMRAGIRRGAIPATPLMTLAAIWMMSRWVYADNKRLNYALAALFLIAGHFFIQSRGPIIGILSSLIVIGVLTGSYRELRNILGAAFVAALIMAVTLPENILITPFTSTVEDVSEGGGTVEGRLKQFEHDVEEFMEHPWIGSGLIVLRVSAADELGSSPKDLWLKVRKADLGYSHWVKMYGLAGIIWLAIVMYILGTRSLRAFRHSHATRKLVSLFAFSYFCFFLITGVTLDHFLIPGRIILFVLLFAIVVSLDQGLGDGTGQGKSDRRDPAIRPDQNPRILRSRQTG